MDWSGAMDYGMHNGCTAGGTIVFWILSSLAFRSEGWAHTEQKDLAMEWKRNYFSSSRQ